MKKRDWINIVIICIAFFLALFLIVGKDYVLGSNLDWINQHFSFADYFRTRFYETGELVPSFAFNIGGGQNIFNFAYYGLLSPWLFVSFLFPKVPMPYFLIFSLVISILSSIVLIYTFLRKRFEPETSLVATLLFALATPILFHLHRHVMFINYMPFVVLALFGVDKYIEKNRSWLLIISVFLTIMTSYFYSVGSIIMISIYAVYKYFEYNKNITLKSAIIDLIKYCGIILLAVGFSAIILLPTAYTLFSGRADTKTSISLISLFLPKVNYKFLLYSHYSLGMTSIIFYSIISGTFSKKREVKFVSIIFLLLLLFPIFVYVLNAGMYIDAKVLIPFLPLATILIAYVLSELFSEVTKRDFIFTAITAIILSVCLVVNREYRYLLDLICLVGAIIVLYRFKSKLIFSLLLIVPALIFTVETSKIDNLVSKEYLDKLLAENNEIISVLNKDTSLYRFGNQIRRSEVVNKIYTSKHLSPTVYSSVSNNYYNNFYFNLIGNEVAHRNNAITSQPSNILFNTVMGVKYLATNNPPIGYKHFSDDIYINENVYPLGYLSYNIVSTKRFERLSFPFNAEVLLNSVVVDDALTREYKTAIDKINLEYEKESRGLAISKENGKYLIKAVDDNYLKLVLEKPIEDKIVFISFDMLHNQSCKIGDTSITINSVKNKLTCAEWKYHNRNYTFEYTISSNEIINEFYIEFTPGTYEIGNIEIYAMEYSSILDNIKNMSKFEVDALKTKGDFITGKINAQKDGYFILTIPYDNGFNIKVDGKKIDYELVNETFIGFKMEKGEHIVEIKYTAPLLTIGKVISLISFVGIIALMIYEKKGSKNVERNIRVL